MKTAKKIIAGFLALTFIGLPNINANASSGKNSLKFNEDGKFTIMVATDLHRSYYENDTEQDKKTEDMQNFLRAAIKKANPDLVIYDGDNAFGKTTAEMEASISMIMEPVKEKDLPFAMVFGNHDTQNGISLEEQLAIFQQYPNCLTVDAVPELTGCGNCNILIKNSTGTRDVFNLWLIDSGAYPDDPEIGGDAWVQDDQIAWYEQTSQALKEQNGGKAIPALGFQHIPVPEIYDLLRHPKFSELADSVRSHVSWAKGLFVPKENVTGYLGEGPCTSNFNNGEFASWVAQGDIIGAFFGHDHYNDIQGTIDGIMLGYCKTAGFVAYGDGGKQAVRIITLDEKNLSSFETHMLTLKELGVKTKSISWLNENLTHKQKIKFYITLAAVVLFPVAGSIYAIKNIRF